MFLRLSMRCLSLAALRAQRKQLLVARNLHWQGKVRRLLLATTSCMKRKACSISSSAEGDKERRSIDRKSDVARLSSLLLLQDLLLLEIRLLQDSLPRPCSPLCRVEEKEEESSIWKPLKSWVCASPPVRPTRAKDQARVLSDPIPALPDSTSPSSPLFPLLPD